MKRLRSRLLLSALTMCAMSSYSDALANYGIPIRDPFSPSPKLRLKPEQIKAQDKRARKAAKLKGTTP